jgi:hypothetical protein
LATNKNSSKKKEKKPLSKTQYHSFTKYTEKIVLERASQKENKNNFELSLPDF